MRRATLTDISQPQAQVLLQGDVQLAEAAIARLITMPLTQNQFDALVSFTFNLGSGCLQRSRLRRCINRGEHGEVPAELMRWVYANGKPLPGLILRRMAEGKLYQIKV